MPSIISGSSQRRVSSRTVPSFSSRSVQNSSWSRSPSSRVSVVLSNSPGAFSASSVVGPLVSSGMMSAARDEKETMQSLNSRLALYLEKVRSLETSNHNLEIKIKELLEERKPTERDINPMLAQARALNKQIQDLTLNNAAILLQMDNAKLSAEDFRMKMESEAMVRQTVEHDMDRLRHIKEEYDGNAFILRNEWEMLTEELLFLKKNHQEELNAIRSQLKNEQITVEVEAEQGPDLTVAIAKIRAEYDEMVAKNKADAEAWYQSQVQTITTEVQKNTKELDMAKAELSSKRQAMQSLEIELETMRRQNIGLENILEDTEERYRVECNSLQITISKLEAELIKIYNEMLRHKGDYEALLKTKLTLEAELCEYRRLLNGEMSIKVVPAPPPCAPAPPPRAPTPPPEPEITTRRIVKVITTTLVDGKVVDESSEVQEFNDQVEK